MKRYEEVNFLLRFLCNVVKGTSTEHYFEKTPCFEKFTIFIYKVLAIHKLETNRDKINFI